MVLRWLCFDGEPDFDETGAGGGVEIFAIELDGGGVGYLVAGLREPRVPNGAAGLADGGDVVAVGEDGVALLRDADALPLCGRVREVGDFDSGDVVEVAVFVVVVDDAVGFAADLAGDVADVMAEPLPERRDAGMVFNGEAAAESCDEHGEAEFKAGGLDGGDECLAHDDWLREVEMVEVALLADGLRGEAELLAEGAGERLVRAVAGVERDRENVGRAVGEHARSFGKAALAHVTHDGLTCGGFKCPGHVEA